MPSEQINAVLEVFKERVGAVVVGVLHVNMFEPYRLGARALWNQIENLDCLDPKPWSAIGRGTAGATEVACRCGGHFVSSFPVDGISKPGRWTLAALTTEPLTRAPDESPLVITVAETAVHGALADLREILRDQIPDDLDLPPEPATGGGGAGPAELGIPLWWARKPS